MEYKVISGFSAHDLQTLVNKYIIEGYIPLGGICFNQKYPETHTAYPTPRSWFFQAMIKEDDK